MAEGDADTGCGHRADNELALTADVDEARSSRHRNGQRGQGDRHGAQQHGGHRARAEEGGVEKIESKTPNGLAFCEATKAPKRPRQTM